MPTLSQVLRSLFLSLLMYFSLRSLGLNEGRSLVGALIPFVLGIIDVLAACVFGLTGIVFIIAVVAHVFPAQFDSVKDLVTNHPGETGRAIELSGSNMASQIETKIRSSLSGTTGVPNNAPVSSGTTPAPDQAAHTSGSGAAVSH